MDPKLQSSFIPKGPEAHSIGTGLYTRRESAGQTVMGVLSVLIFVISIVAALGVFGYTRYLTSRIGSMGADLEEARATINPELIKKITSLDNRLISTKDLLNKHTVLSPFFSFLESATLQSVSYTEFSYNRSKEGKINLILKGLARGYQAVALQSNVFTGVSTSTPAARNLYFKSPVFSDLHLSEKGEVVFTFSSTVDPALVSYQKFIQASAAKATSTAPVSAPQATSTATTTKAKAQ
ncbi:hypothetical protein KW785_02065 [Candidatus Parcubacteria bacterium]|nr:hypothetical protein [Candidatus Parcubacteria bacterium]